LQELQEKYEKAVQATSYDPEKDPEVVLMQPFDLKKGYQVHK